MTNLTTLLNGIAVEALEKTIVPLEWWARDYPNEGHYTTASYLALLKTKEALKQIAEEK